jgi:hypothetical protein
MVLRPLYFGRTSLPRGRVAAEVSYSDEAETLFAAFSAEPDATRKGVIDALIVSLKTASVWDKLDCLWLTAAHDAQAAGINWKVPATFALTVVNSPTFAADRGYTGNGTSSYLSTGFTPSTAGGVYAQNNAHVGVWSRTSAQSGTGVSMGGEGTTNTVSSRLFLRNTSDVAVARLNQGPSGGVGTASLDGSGHFVGRRSASNAVALFRNGASIGTSTTNSTGLTTVPLYFGAYNDEGVAAGFAPRQHAAAHLGSSLTDQNIADLYAAMLTYMQAVGAA